jgi:hypothetical protein
MASYSALYFERPMAKTLFKNAHIAALRGYGLVASLLNPPRATITGFSHKRCYGERLRIMRDTDDKRFGDPNIPAVTERSS